MQMIGHNLKSQFDDIWWLWCAQIETWIFQLLRKKVKGKGLGTCYSAAYEIRTAALYSLGSGS